MAEQWTGVFIDFPQDDRYWRVDWLGDFLHEINTPTEPKIAVMLSPLDPEKFQNHNVRHVNIVKHQEQIIIYINVGYLPYIHKGAFFKNGRLIVEPRFRKYKIEKQILEITNGKTARILPANFQIQHGDDTDFIIPQKAHRLGHKGLETKLFAIDHGNTKNKYLIPTIEIGRHFYFNSTKLTRQLLWGGLKGSNTIYNPAKSYLTEDGQGFLCLREKIDDADSWVVSQFAFNKDTFNRVTQIHNSIIKCKLEDKPLNPEILPPIDGTYKLTMNGKWIKSGGDWRFLVFWIQLSNYSFPTGKLNITRDNDGRNNGTHNNSLPIYKRNIKNNFLGKRKQSNLPELTTREEPDKNISNILSLLHDSRFEWLTGKQYKKLPPGEHTHRADPNNHFITPSIVDTVATGDGLHNDTNIAALNIQSSQNYNTHTKSKRPKAPSADLDKFETVLKNLTLLNASYRFITFDSFSPSDEKYCHFPSFNNSRRSSWSLNDHNEPRRLLLVEITFLDSIFYLFEAEVRKEKSLTTLLLHNVQYSIIHKDILSKVIYSTTKNKGVWDKSRASSELCYRKLKHTWVQSTDFATTLLDEFKSHINQTSDKCELCFTELQVEKKHP